MKSVIAALPKLVAQLTVMALAQATPYAPLRLYRTIPDKPSQIQWQRRWNVDVVGSWFPSFI